MRPQLTKQISSPIQEQVKKGTIASSKVDRYLAFMEKINKELLPHEVITHNQYTAWFKKGEFGLDEVRHFLKQFSVFSNLFLEAQLKKTINAPSLEAMHASKEILMNELGVSFKNPNRKEKKLEEDDVESEGTVEGGVFRFTAAHFEWLLRMTSHVGLNFSDIGKRRHGTQSTVFFCDELSRLYGSEDPHVALGASFAVENWAAAGFWKELITGFETFKKRECPTLPLGFFKWHDMVEDQHAQHTRDELEEDFFAMEVDEKKFMKGGLEMLDGVLAFWNGLNEDRKSRH